MHNIYAECEHRRLCGPSRARRELIGRRVEFHNPQPQLPLLAMGNLRATTPDPAPFSAADESSGDLHQDPRASLQRATTSGRVNGSDEWASSSDPYPALSPLSLDNCLPSGGWPLPSGPAVCVRQIVSCQEPEGRAHHPTTRQSSEANANLAPFQCRGASKEPLLSDGGTFEIPMDIHISEILISDLRGRKTKRVSVTNSI